MIKQISFSEFTVGYVDACPSELLQKSNEEFLCLGLVTFFRVDRESLKPLSQFKKVRGIARRVQTQDYIIEKINEQKIIPCGLVSWNFRELALKNGLFILKDANIIDKDFDSDKIQIANYEVSIGLATSLAWYSIIISVFLKYIGKVASIQQMKKVAIFLDLLPGDNNIDQRNMKIVEYIIDNSRLLEFYMEAIEENELEGIGYGYGMHEQSTKEFKNDFEFVITDWIIQSFHSLLKYEKEKLGKESEAFQLSKLARFLVNENRFEIRNAFNIEE